MKKDGQDLAPTVGGSSLLVIFAVLCLTVFTLLALSTVQADKRLSDASAQAVTDYYRADLEAEKIAARLRRGEIPRGVVLTQGRYCFTCPISETQQLEVELEADSGEIIRWQSGTVSSWGKDGT